MQMGLRKKFPYPSRIQCHVTEKSEKSPKGGTRATMEEKKRFKAFMCSIISNEIH